MEETSLSRKISTHLISNFVITKNSNGNIKIGDEFSMSGRGLAKRFTHEFFKDKRKLEDIDKDLIYKSDSELVSTFDNVLDNIKNILNQYLVERTISQNQNDEVQWTAEMQRRLIPVVNLEDPNGTCIMVDSDSMRPTEVKERSWAKTVGTQHVNSVMQQGASAFFEYNPTTIEPYKEIEVSNSLVKQFNLYIPPKHRLERDYEAKLHPKYIEYLEGFFEDSCREYAYNWIYHSTFRKMPTYLVLVGAGGIGKNLLADSLEVVHGKSNFTKAQPSALNSNFNGHLSNNTMIYYDECNFSADRDNKKKNRLKEWANDTLSIEKKGVDAKLVRVYGSAIIATNNDSDVHLEQLDRKFSVMEITKERLEKRIGTKATNEIWEYIKRDPTFPDALLNYLEPKIDPEFNPNIEYKGRRFDELVISSLHNWQHELLFGYVLDSEVEEIPFNTLKDNITMFPKAIKVQDFLNNFTYEGQSLGKIIGSERKYRFKINEYFLNVEAKTTLEE